MKRGQLEGKPPCPRCKGILDGYTALEGTGPPKPGDYTICGHCAAPLTWDGFAFLPLTGSDLVLARLNHRFVAAEAIARMMRGGLRQ